MPQSLSTIFGALIGKALAPGEPKGTGIVDQALATEYGVNPKQQQALKDLQGKLASATTYADKAKIQKQIDDLQKNISTTAGKGYTSNFLQNLASEFPQLQNIANTQNAAAAQGGIGLQNQFGLPAGQAILGAQTALAPQFYGGQQQLGQDLFGSPLGLSPQETQFFTNQLNAGQAAQGLYGSPLSAQNTALNLTGLNLAQANTQEQQRQQYLNSYLQPLVPNLFTPAANPLSAGQLGGQSLQSLGPQDFLSLQAGLSGLKYNNQAQFASQLGGGLGSLGSDIIMAAATGGMGGMGGMAGGMMGGAGGAMGGMGGLMGMFGGSPSGGGGSGIKWQPTGTGGFMGVAP